jgi:DNA-binding LytR/AlgR family response regulator
LLAGQLGNHCKIAICDDEKNMRESILSLIKAQCRDCHVDLFSSGTELLNTPMIYDIYFLDIQMPGLTGIETAERLRAQHAPDSVIIFVTALKDYMADAFDVKAFHYLVKPVDAIKFKTVFAKAMNEYQKQSKNADKHILVKSGSIHHKIFIKDILYIESQGKKVIVNTVNGIMEYRDKIQELENSLGESFFRCHRCYLVNLSHVVRYSATVIWLTNGSEIHLAQKKFQDFVKAYMLFAKSGGLIND